MKRERTNKNERKQRKCEKERKKKTNSSRKKYEKATTARKQAFSTFSLIQNASCLHRRY